MSTASIVSKVWSCELKRPKYPVFGSTYFSIKLDILLALKSFRDIYGSNSTRQGYAFAHLKPAGLLFSGVAL